MANSGIELTGLKPVEAERLLLGLQGQHHTAQSNEPEFHREYSAIKDIVQELHGFPLALDQAADFVRENAPMTFGEYLEFLAPRSEDRELLLRFKEAHPKYPESIMTTWEISLRYLEAAHPRSSRILQLLGFFDQSSVSERLLKSATARSLWEFETQLVMKEYR